MSYLGSKGASGAYQAIIANMPPHDTYIETHLGSGVVLRKKPAAARTIGIDLDCNVLKNSLDLGVELYEVDACSFLEEFDFDSAGRTLIYSDPPYVHSSRTSGERYKHEYSDHDHIRLINTLNEVGSRGVAIMLSGYPSKLYEDIIPTSWHSIQFQVMTRGGVRTEQLWMNFVPGSAAHWAAFAGRNYTDRQRIKRKAAGWAEKYRKLPMGERMAIMAELLQIGIEE